MGLLVALVAVVCTGVVTAFGGGLLHPDVAAYPELIAVSFEEVAGTALSAT